MTNQYETILHRWFDEVWNKGCAETIDELLDPNVLIHGLVDSSGNEVSGAAQFKSFYESFRAALPDIQVIVEDGVSDGNKIVVRCTVRATHAGEGLGVSPTGNAVEFTGMCMVKEGDGRIVEVWNNFDFLTMMQQVGAVTVG